MFLVCGVMNMLTTTENIVAKANIYHSGLLRPLVEQRSSNMKKKIK